MELIKSILLVIIAILLIGIFVPFSIIFTIIILLFGFSIKKVYYYICDLLYNIALSLDQFGNVTCMYLFNYLLIKNNSNGFGNVDETVSSVLGRHKLNNNLTKVGKLLDNILNIFEKNHTLKSIGS